jgi:hypothetical protein
MTDDEIIQLAHRTAWRYKHSSDQNRILYTFNQMTLLEFVRKLAILERNSDHNSTTL